jgi:hypothetical protein
VEYLILLLGGHRGGECSSLLLVADAVANAVADAVAGAAALEVETLVSGEQVANGWQRKEGGLFLCSRVL